MKKTLLAAALAVGFVGAAQAETSVTLYGIIDTGVGYNRIKAKEFDTDWRNGQVNINDAGKYTKTGIYDGTSHGQAGSRWGLKGTEDLGNGLRAEFMLEGGIDVTTGTSNQGGRLFGRQAWLGLAGDSWGALRFGRQHNVCTDFMLGMVDPFGGGFGLAHPGAAFSAIDTNRMDNTIKYVTPNFSGFQAGVAYSFEHTGPQGWKEKGSSNPNNRAISAGLRYANGPIGVALTYDQMKNSSLGGYQDKAVKQWNIGGAYDFEVVKVSAAFGQNRDGIYANGFDLFSSGGAFVGSGGWNGALNPIGGYDKGFRSNSYMVGLSAPIGGGTLMASWAMMDPRTKSDFIRDFEDATG